MVRTGQRLGVCLLVVALLATGCQAPIADSSGGDTPAATAVENGSETVVGTAPNITVRNASLTLGPGEVFTRLQTVAGTTVAAPRSVRVFDTSEEFYNSTPDGLGSTTPAFWRVAGLETGPVNDSALEIQKNGYVTGGGGVTVYLGPNATTADERLLLAHEFTHFIQVQNGRQATLTAALDRGTTDSSYVRRAVVEGAAVVTTDAYVREYAAGDQLNSPWYDEIQDSYPPGHVGQFQNGRYVHGYDYVDARVGSPTALPALYEDPPQTSEQILHGLDPGEESPTPLTVESTTADGWVASGTDRMGEAFVRYALASDVGQARAARAASGWGNDELHIFRPIDGGNASYVWVLDWDDPTEATEFAQSLGAAFDARGEETDGVWSLSDAGTTATITEVSEGTTAVVFGSEPFVTETTVTASGDSVRIAARSGTSEQG